jgi:hypothetical protein
MFAKPRWHLHWNYRLRERRRAEENRRAFSDQLMGMEDERRRNILEILSVLSVT